MHATRSSSRAEGTLLTVFAAFAAKLQQLAEGAATDFRRLFAAALPAARVALDRTRTMLDVLRSANVVDAGAAGFVLLVEGMKRLRRRASSAKSTHRLTRLTSRCRLVAVRASTATVRNAS